MIRSSRNFQAELRDAYGEGHNDGYEAAMDRINELEDKIEHDKAVINAAFKWAESFGDRSGTYFGTELSLHGAVKKHPDYKGK